MQTAYRMTTRVHAGGKVELLVPQIPSEEMVEVIILFPADETMLPTLPKRSALEILAELPGHRLFKTASDVDSYLQQERESWDS